MGEGEREGGSGNGRGREGARERGGKAGGGRGREGATECSTSLSESPGTDSSRRRARTGRCTRRCCRRSPAAPPQRSMAPTATRQSPRPRPSPPAHLPDSAPHHSGSTPATQLHCVSLEVLTQMLPHVDTICPTWSDTTKPYHRHVLYSRMWSDRHLPWWVFIVDATREGGREHHRRRHYRV